MVGMPTLKDVLTTLPFISTIQQRLGNSEHSNELSSVRSPELPGGTPFSLCSVSRNTDLFDIKSVELTQQPLYFDDGAFVHLYGTFRDTWSVNATMRGTVDCGSHCEMYGVPPDERAGSSFHLPFCGISDIEQPTGGKKKNETCPPVKGAALITSEIYVWPMFLNVPGWYNFTFDAKTIDGDRIYCITAEVCLRWEDPEKNKGYPKGPWSNCQWPR